MRAYLFLEKNMRSGGGEEKPWKVGEERTLNAQELELCVEGYHSSPSWYAALRYAPGPVACIVEVSEPEDRDIDKQVSRTRKLIAAKDASRELRLFACDCAERALKAERKAGREPDSRSWAAIEVARRFANGNTTEEELHLAETAARSAAENAESTTETAAESAAWSATLSAANAANAASAAWNTALTAAWSAALSTASPAWSAAENAATRWQTRRLRKLLDPLFATRPGVMSERISSTYEIEEPLPSVDDIPRIPKYRIWRPFFENIASQLENLDGQVLPVKFSSVKEADACSQAFWWNNAPSRRQTRLPYDTRLRLKRRQERVFFWLEKEQHNDASA